LRRLITICLGLVLFFGCKRNQTEPLDLGYNYFPLTIGAFVDYQVDSTVYNDFTQSDTTYSFTIRETVRDTFSDAQGRLTYRIERSKRVGDTASFVIQKSMGINVEATRLERLEDNIRTVILSFPPDAGSAWNGNAYNNRGQENFEIISAHKPATVNGTTFDSVVTVEQYNDTANFIEKRYRQERFAKNLGIISIEYIDIRTKLNGDSGVHYVQQIIN
jgi:hypothetical protein